jgi:tetratricopeptide (TPR) repeat protein
MESKIKKQTEHREELTQKDFLRSVKDHLKNGRGKAAYAMMQQAIIDYPEDPLIMSYYGCLQAVVDKRYRTGVETCRKSFGLVTSDMEGKQAMAAILCLNLGRAYFAAGKRVQALEAFEKGLKYEKGNRELISELQALGKRKKPPLPFLSRSNPLNKYIGLLLHKKTNKQPAAVR